MRFNTAPAGVLYLKLVEQKRQKQILAYTLLASDQAKVTHKTAIYSKMFTADFEFEDFPLYAQDLCAKLNFASYDLAEE
jgi:hypothetical protein